MLTVQVLDDALQSMVNASGKEAAINISALAELLVVRHGLPPESRQEVMAALVRHGSAAGFPMLMHAEVQDRKAAE